MTHVDTKIQHYIAPGRRVHLSGIGGVSMCPLAEVLHGMGLKVQGSDMKDSATVEHLRSLGIPRDRRPYRPGHRRGGISHPYRRHPRRQP